MRLQDLFTRNDSLVGFNPGQTIFKEGEHGDTMFILYEGIVDVLVGSKVVGSFEPIEIFGEMAVIDPGPRSATVVAKTRCEFAAINQARFMFLLQHKPEFALHILRILVERIRWMDAAARSQPANVAENIVKLDMQVQNLAAPGQAQAIPLGEKAARIHENAPMAVAS